MKKIRAAVDLSLATADAGWQLVETKVFRRCINCGYEGYDCELVLLREGTKAGYMTDGFIKCEKCHKNSYAWFGMRDKRRKG
jgi:hypothetical protein